MNTAVASFRHFAHEHDDLVAFHAGYLVLAFLSASFFNLGAFGLLVFTHMVLDWVKYREKHRFGHRQAVEGIVRENLVDVTLLLVGVVFSLYLHHSVGGVASVSGLMRAEISIIRMAALLVPKLKILHHFLKMIAHLHHYLDAVHPHHRKGWSALDQLCFYFCGLSFFLIVFAAPIMSVDFEIVKHILAEELIPWRV
ncbi:hypothetical protein COU75_04305 [Candidatus Peregrinibacteria bacterium CG10_big_fil_rev_8_21_14_0_10_42_8]|nr:MAG: hypothetical protein COU75_04305 [Candidatus Peregrinibacteria bacterium CG10_big_fil_rev_8_21_14_0_10_42_8]